MILPQMPPPPPRNIKRLDIRQNQISNLEDMYLLLHFKKQKTKTKYTHPKKWFSKNLKTTNTNKNEKRKKIENKKKTIEKWKKGKEKMTTKKSELKKTSWRKFKTKNKIESEKCYW